MFIDMDQAKDVKGLLEFVMSNGPVTFSDDRGQSALVLLSVGLNESGVVVVVYNDLSNGVPMIHTMTLFAVDSDAVSAALSPDMV